MLLGVITAKHGAIIKLPLTNWLELGPVAPASDKGAMVGSQSQKKSALILGQRWLVESPTESDTVFGSMLQVRKCLAIKPASRHDTRIDPLSPVSLVSNR